MDIIAISREQNQMQITAVTEDIKEECYKTLSLPPKHYLSYIIEKSVILLIKSLTLL